MEVKGLINNNMSVGILNRIFNPFLTAVAVILTPSSLQWLCYFNPFLTGVAMIFNPFLTAGAMLF